MGSEKIPQVWRVSVAGRLGSCLAIVVSAPWGMVALVEGDVLLGLAILAVLFVGVWLGAFHPRIILTSSDLIVINPWGKRQFALIDIDATEPGYDGMQILLRSGRRSAGWAVQESNIRLFNRNHSRAKAVSAAINEALTSASE